ncbi:MULTISPECIES: ABC transporter permease [unclassified Corynebacterium]|uniref:ABC transporter permease n=1 Tax=unclassified Corynebacterium TaxID=2624378 RepID=UPI00264BF1B8|nr:ABC transporter permease [Corynebacterium sp.]MDN6258981.1 ABC transporter permease [Corynebacterium sp.]MDN6509803.1 ABC transporter permease [Corynebacterium sp.]
MLRRLSGEDKLLIIGIPVLVAVVFLGWVTWRQTADLGDVETRALAWGSVATMAREHIVLVVMCAVIVLATAVPVGVLLTRRRSRILSLLTTLIGNIGQSAPVIGVIVLLAIWLGFGTPTAVLSLSIYAFLPVLANTVAGLTGVDRQLVEAARGMGMSPVQVLFRVEFPMALPVIMTGARTALVLLVGAGAFATFIDAGGLGALIQTGITLYRFNVLVSGAILIALLALMVEWVGRLLEVALTPKGL